MTLPTTISAMKSLIRNSGNNYFNEDTEKFWGSKVLTAPDKYGVFIESTDDWDREKKIFHVKIFAPVSRQIHTVTFGLSTLEEAVSEMTKFEKELVRQSGEREKAVLSDFKEISITDSVGVYKVCAEHSDDYFEIHIPSGNYEPTDFSRLICG